jgi:cytochrome c oxidase subunit 1
MSLLFLLAGGTLAMLMRWQLGFPTSTLPGGGLLPDTMVQDGTILPEFYNSLVTMHGTFMVFFAIMPLLVGVFGNYLIPLKIGAPDMAFPRINMMSFWVAVPAGIMMLAGFFVEGGHAAAGWTAYAPLSDNPEWSGVSTGQQLWCVSLIVLGLSSILGSFNYITTIINMRAPGMNWFRLPLSIWALFVTAILVLLAMPVLSGALIMLLFDQTIGTHFFLPDKGISSGSSVTPRSTSSSCRRWGWRPTSSPTDLASRSSATPRWCSPFSRSGSSAGACGATTCS